MTQLCRKSILSGLICNFHDTVWVQHGWLMALFVWYMFTEAVVTCGIVPMAIYVHTILPVSIPCCINCANHDLHSCTFAGNVLYGLSH